MLKYLQSLRGKSNSVDELEPTDDDIAPIAPMRMDFTLETSEFLTQLGETHLIADDKLHEYQTLHQAAPLDDRAWAERLVNERIISTFQATRVLQGRASELIYNDYRVVHKLHDGGVGMVYLAQHATQPGWFALKVLKPNRRDDPAAVDMFRLEALAVTTLRHPNIVRGVEYSPYQREHEQGFYLAMDFVRGPNLGELLAIRRELPIGQACDIIMQAAEGLHAAHVNHFLHRDVKPGNLIIDKSGVAKLVDFGFARYTGSELPFPVASTVRPGTLGFYAPEALTGERMRDRRSDIYSLGLSLYFALSGVSPFSRETKTATFVAQREEAPRPITELRADLPSELVAVLERMIAPESQDRYATMAEVVQALEPFAVREELNVSMRALLRARARLQPRDYLVSSAPAPKAPPIASPPAVATAPRSELQKLEAFVRRISDQLTVLRAENRRLSDELEHHIGHRAELEQQQAEQTQLRFELKRVQEENARLTAEAAESRKSVETLSMRCVELETSLAEYQQQVSELNQRVGSTTESPTIEASTAPRSDDQQLALRAAYEQATPVVDNGEPIDPLDEVFADDSMLREIAQAHWATLRGHR